jgi:hypothetical protein
MNFRVTHPLQNVINGWSLLVIFKRTTAEFRVFEYVLAGYTAFLQEVLQSVKVVESPSQSAQFRWTRPSKLTPRISHIMAILKFALLVLPAGWLTQDQLNQLNQQTAQEEICSRVRKALLIKDLHPLIPRIRKFFECFTTIDSDPVHWGALLTR